MNKIQCKNLPFVVTKYTLTTNTQNGPFILSLIQNTQTRKKKTENYYWFKKLNIERVCYHRRAVICVGLHI